MDAKAKAMLAGVATVGALLFPGPTVAVAATAMPSDFNGDGFADLAIGVPGEAIGAKRLAGGVNVLYGSGTGLTAAGDQFWSQDSPGVKGVSADSGFWSGDGLGKTLASGDFDGDGFADLAIGVPGDRGVNVLYGSAAGLTADGDQLWTPAALSLPGGYAFFGGVMASGDFDADGYWDLAMHASLPTALNPDGLGDAGRVVVVRGGIGGLGAADLVILDRSMTGAPTVPDLRYEFGISLAAGDLDGDGHDDLAVGVQIDDDHVALADVSVFYGSEVGLTGDASESWSQTSIGDEGDMSDLFGWALAIGDFDADGFGDLAVGAPMGRFPIDTAWGNGSVAVIYGSAAGLTAVGNQSWHEDAPGIPSAGHHQERFGYALAAGDLDGDGADDLAVGVPGEGSGASGAVIAIYGGVAGLSATGSQLWSQASPGVPGSRERGDRFGFTLASANYGRSGRDDLAIGVPGEDVGGRSNAGVVNVLYGRASGLRGTNAQAWSQGTGGIKEALGKGDAFGSSVTP